MSCRRSLAAKVSSAIPGKPRLAASARRRVAGFGLLATALLCLAGCSTDDSHLQSLREQLMLPEEPQHATTIAAAKEQVAERPRVVCVGRIAANYQDAFTSSEAAFLITELLPAEHKHRGHADDCPFCKRKTQESPWAAVRFVDTAGKTLAVDARKLFGIKPGDTVVVRGTGQLTPELDLLIVTADGIHLRQPGAKQ